MSIPSVRSGLVGLHTPSFVAVCLLLVATAGAQTFFTDVTEEVGLDLFPGRQARNIVFVDYDNDGFQDLFITEDIIPAFFNAPRRIGLFRNTGDGHFVDQTDLIPPDLHVGMAGAGAVFGDYDNDGDEDLFLPVWPHDVLLRNDRGAFVPVALDTDTLGTDAAIWLDYDQDGYIDLYAANWFIVSNTSFAGLVEGKGNYPNRLLRNNGDGTFSGQTGAGIDIQFDARLDPTGPVGGSTGGPVSADFNGDGWPDLYLGIDSQPNRLFLNDGQGRFVDATTGEIDDEGAAFNVSVGDIDNDGDLDLFQPGGSSPVEGFRSLMLLNLGDAQFLDVTEGVGLSLQLLGTNAGGTAFVDIDNDGDLDLIIAVASGRNFLFLNDGSGIFTEATTSSGIEDVGPYVALGDYDEDGFIDLSVGSLTGLSRGRTALYRNNGNDNHWLRVELVGTESNRSAIGARLFATSGDLEQMREIIGGLGRSQDEKVAHFGLGERTQVDRLEIRWPSGQVDVLFDISADQKIRIVEGSGRYHVARPSVWQRPPPAVVVGGRAIDLSFAVRPALFEPAAEINRVVADLSALGGPAAVPLTVNDDGSYALETRLNIPVARSVVTVFIQIEQATSLGPFWTSLSREITIAPEDDLGIFADRESWTLSSQWLDKLTDHPAPDFWPTWSPDGQRIAFMSLRNGGDLEIYTMDADGSNPVNLTDNPGQNDEPFWSSDGSRILFTSWRDDDPEIYAMDPDGSNQVNLTNSPGRDAWARSSPDGRKIVFSSQRDDNPEVYVMDADGSNPIRLTDHPAGDGQPHWSPDGRKIAFLSDRDGNGEIYVMDADGSNPVNLTNHPGFDRQPHWSPDGRKIAFYSNRDGNGEIYVMDADGANPVNLSNHPGYDDAPSWSPDGQLIAFTSARDQGSLNIFVLEPKPTERVVLNPDQRTIVHQGTTALQVQTTSGRSRLFYHAPEPLDPVGYAYLHFAFHPGDVEVAEESAFRVDLGANQVDILGAAGAGVDPTLREWQVVDVPIKRFGINGQTSIEQIAFSGNLQGTFYLDDIRLVAAKPIASPSTAVLEEHTGAVPDVFALDQNFPNPFNSGTVISFALPALSDATLTVYNLVGQKVATLLDDTHAAGTYTVRWDGRDDAGQTLASGMYLYRFRAGTQAITRKLLILR